MASIDLSDPEIKKGVDDVINTSTKTNWILLTYAPRSSTKIRVIGTGIDGWDEMCDEVSDGKVCYGFCRFTINEVFRYVYLSWIGEGVQGMQAGAYNTHSNVMQRVFEGYHVQVNGRNDADLWEDDIIARLTKAIGVNYDAGEVIQGTQGNSGSAPKKIVKTDDISIDQNESAKFWESQNASEPASGYKKDLSYQKASGASSLKNKFENLAEQQRPGTAVERSTPKPIHIDTSSGPTVIESEPIQSNISYDNQNTGATYETETYDEGGYDEGGYEEEGYAEEGYAEEGYEEEGYAEEGYEEEGYAEEGYAEEGYEEEGYAEEGYEEGGYEEEGYEEIYATALYDYTGENEDDLSFNTGDSIQVLDQTDPSGWWKGYIDGREGFFPSNFVELQ